MSRSTGYLAPHDAHVTASGPDVRREPHAGHASRWTRSASPRPPARSRSSACGDMRASRPGRGGPGEPQHLEHAAQPDLVGVLAVRALAPPGGDLPPLVRPREVMLDHLAQLARPLERHDLLTFREVIPDAGRVGH